MDIKYPTSFEVMVMDLESEGFKIKDIVRTASFVKGSRIQLWMRVTQTFRNNVYEMLVKNA